MNLHTKIIKQQQQIVPGGFARQGVDQAPCDGPWEGQTESQVHDSGSTSPST